MTMNGNLYSSGDATILGSPWTGDAYFRTFSMQGNLAVGYTPAIYDLLAKTADGKFKKFDGDDVSVVAESMTLVASAGQLANKLDVNVIAVTDDPATTTYEYGVDYVFTDDGAIEALGGGSIGATDDILITYTHTPKIEIVGILERYNSTTYENNVLVELKNGEVDLAKVNIANSSANVLSYIAKKLKLINISVL